YHAGCTDEAGHERFCVMERRLFAITTLGGALTVGFGLWLMFGYWMQALPDAGWLHAKLALVTLLVLYHAWCWPLIRAFRRRANRHSARWYRWFNEVPGPLLIAIVLLAVLKPF